jgi:hypothetical protein
VSSGDSVLTTLVRMVVPMRRELGFSLDVHQFVHDQQYAATVLDKARSSADPKLREFAAHVERQLFGPRATAAAVEAPAPAAAPAPKPAAATTEDELRAKMLRKYTTGLR